MSREYIESTPTMRRRLLVVFVAIAMIAAVLEFWVKPALFEFVNSLPACERLPWWRGLILSALGILPLVAVSQFILARRMLIACQYPLPGSWVFRRTAVKRGRQVQIRAYGLIVIGLAEIAAALYFGWQILGSPLFTVAEQCAPNPSLNADGPHAGLRPGRGSPGSLIR